MINKWGKEITLAPTGNTYGERVIVSMLKTMGQHRIEMGFSYPTPYRRNKFDIAVFKDGEDMPSLLIEFDGEPHSDSQFYLDNGNRPCRNDVHVMKTMRSDAIKYKIAEKFGAHVLRVLYEELKNREYVRRKLAIYMALFVDDLEEKSPEVFIAKVREMYLADMPYVVPSSCSKAETAYVADMDARGVEHIVCEDAPCMSGDECPYGLV